MDKRKRNWILIIIAVAFILIYGAAIRDGDPDFDTPATQSAD